MPEETLASVSQTNRDNEALITLAEIGNVDASELKEIRFETLPKLHAMWQITNGKIETLGDKPAIWYECTILQCESVMNKEGETQYTPQDMVGKTHRETFFPRNKEDLGRWKAWIVDVGVQWTGPAPVPELHKHIVAQKPTFPGKIYHQQDKNDKEKVYSRLEPVPPKKRAQGQQQAA